MYEPSNEAGAPSQEAIAHVMADLAAGRGSRVFDLAELARRPLERLVRGTLVRYGHRSVAADRSEVDFLVLTAAMVIFDRSSGWRPDGSPPWVWARHAIRSAIAGHIGHATTGHDPADLIDRQASALSASGPVVRGDGSLDSLVQHDHRFQVLLDALALVAGARDRQVVLAFLDQKYAGDPSPSHTVAELFGLSPVNVRKIHSRVRSRVALLAHDDVRFASLERGDWLRDAALQGPTVGGAGGIHTADPGAPGSAPSGGGDALAA